MARRIAVAALGILLSASATALNGSQTRGTTGTSSGAFRVLDYLETDLPSTVYIAKSELIKDLGASLLYPKTDDETRQAGPGIHRLPNVPTSFVRAQRERDEILGAEQILATVIGDPETAVTEHRIQTVSLPSQWAIRR
jgi:hypothetical protein